MHQLLIPTPDYETNLRRFAAGALAGGFFPNAYIPLDPTSFFFKGQHPLHLHTH